MRKNFSSILMALIFILAPVNGFAESDSTQSNTPKVQVAILTFENSDKKEKLNFLSEHLPAAIERRFRRDEKVQIQERRKIDKILQEIELNQSGLFETNGNQLQNITKLFQADFIIMGQFSKSSSEIRILFRLVQASSGKVRYVGSITSDNLLELMANLEATSGEALAEMFGERAASLSVDSQPGNAKVYLDGNYIGNTPLVAYSATAGSHSLILKKEFYIDTEKKTKLVAGKKQKITEQLFLKIRESYSGRIYFNWSFASLNTPLSSGAKTITPDISFNFGYDFHLHNFLVGSFLQVSGGKRSHAITVFSKPATEVRQYTTIYWGFKVSYQYMIHPAYLAIIPGISFGYRYFADSAIWSDERRVPYAIGYHRFQTAAHLTLDIFPGSFLGLYLQSIYLPSLTLDSFDGTFNPLGQKVFNRVEVDVSQLKFYLGVRMAIGSISKSHSTSQPSYWDRVL